VPGTGPAPGELPTAGRDCIPDGLLLIGIKRLFVDVDPPDGERHPRRQEVDQSGSKGLRVQATVAWH
jgi:hypothetical protein